MKPLALLVRDREVPPKKSQSSKIANFGKDEAASWNLPKG
jgi:hypothetical protein